jgi:hypothetical protein
VEKSAGPALLAAMRWIITHPAQTTDQPPAANTPHVHGSRKCPLVESQKSAHNSNVASTNKAPLSHAKGPNVEGHKAQIHPQIVPPTKPPQMLHAIGKGT